MWFCLLRLLSATCEKCLPRNQFCLVTGFPSLCGSYSTLRNQGPCKWRHRWFSLSIVGNQPLCVIPKQRLDCVLLDSGAAFFSGELRAVLQAARLGCTKWRAQMWGHGPPREVGVSVQERNGRHGSENWGGLLGASCCPYLVSGFTLLIHSFDFFLAPKQHLLSLYLPCFVLFCSPFRWEMCLCWFFPSLPSSPPCLHLSPLLQAKPDQVVRLAKLQETPASLTCCAITRAATLQPPSLHHWLMLSVLTFKILWTKYFISPYVFLSHCILWFFSLLSLHPFFNYLNVIISCPCIPFSKMS